MRSEHQIPLPPTLSVIGRSVLAAAHRRDLTLHAEAGAPLADLRAAYAAMSPDDRAALLLDGFRWRHYWRAEATTLRAEREQAEHRRAMAESSAAIANALGHTTAEMQRRRYPPDGDAAAWVRNGPPGHREHPGADRSRHDHGTQLGEVAA
jgi:integrase